MKIGYACICLDAQFHFETCIQKFATEDRLRSIIRAIWKHCKSCWSIMQGTTSVCIVCPST